MITPLSILTVVGQTTRVTEEEIQLQQKFLLGIGQMQIGKLEAAIKSFNEVLDKNAKCDACAYQLSRCYAASNDNQKAIEFAKRAVQLDPKNVWYKLEVAERYEQIGKDRDAADTYQQLANVWSPTDDFIKELYFRLAETYLRTSDSQKAIKALDELEKKMGYDEEIARQRIKILLKNNDINRAKTEFKRLATTYPYATEAQYAAAEFLSQNGDKAAAEEIYRTVLARNPNDAKARMALVGSSKTSNTNGKLANFKEIFAKTDIGIDTKIKEILPYVQQVPSSKDTEMKVNLLELAQILEQTHPTEAKAYALYADMLYHNNRPAEALQKYRKCLEINKTVFSVWEQYFYTLNELGEYAELAKTTETAMDYFPNNPLSYVLNGTANTYLGKFGDATSSYNQALMMLPKTSLLRADVLGEVGSMYAKSKNNDAADKAFEEALKLNPKSANAQIRYANALILRGGTNTDRARIFAEEALKTAQDTNPSVLEWYGDFCFRDGNTDRAVQYWEKSQKQGNKSAILQKKITDKKLVE